MILRRHGRLIFFFFSVSHIDIVEALEPSDTLQGVYNPQLTTHFSLFPRVTHRHSRGARALCHWNVCTYMSFHGKRSTSLNSRLILLFPPLSPSFSMPHTDIVETPKPVATWQGVYEPQLKTVFPLFIPCHK